MGIENALLIHCMVIAATIAVSAWVLLRRGLLTILHSAPWIMLAVTLYFLFNPAASLLSDDLTRYDDALRVLTRDGAWRVYWTLGVIVAGIAAFLAAYCWGRHRSSPETGETAQFRLGRWSFPELLVLAALLIVASYSILYFRTRAQFVETGGRIEFEGGRVVGGATGYSIVAHNFMLFCVAILLIRGPWIARWLALAVAGGFVLLRLYDAHDRASIVAIIAAMAMVSLALSKQTSLEAGAAIRRFLEGRVRVGLLLGLAAAMALFLVARGHTPISRFEEVDIERTQEVFRQNDTAMLPVLYLESYLAEDRGYDYAVPLASAALFGWIPRQTAPWKDDLQRILLGSQDRHLSTPEEVWLRGAKSTVMGSLYRHGGAVAVVLGMFVLGLAARRLDRLVATGTTDLGRALGIVWMANIWIMFGSSDVWILQNLFIHAIPFACLWLAGRIRGRMAPVFTGTVRAGGGHSRR